MKFPTSKVATQYLSGLKGVEIGGSAHNSFELDTINVDYTADYTTVYKLQEKELCGEIMEVDIIADASKLPFPDKKYDFIINSHVLEHLWNPIGAIKEWKRVARKYILIIVPHKELTFDKDKEVTPLIKLIERHIGETVMPRKAPEDDHFTIWDSSSFKGFCKYMEIGFGLKILEFEDPDLKVGNGMLVLFEIPPPEPKVIEEQPKSE